MTEFRRTSAAVDAVVKLVADLSAERGDAISDKARSNFSELQRQLAELAPVTEKMQRKCEARHELEEAKEALRVRLPGHPEDALKGAQLLVDAGGEEAEAIRPLLNQALELEGTATYGSKMVEKVLELLTKYNTARAHNEAELVPRLAMAVGDAEVAERKCRAEADAAAAAQAQKAEEELRQPVVGLLAENEERLRQLREEEEEAERARAAEAEAQHQAEAAREAEEGVLRRAEEEGERRLLEVGAEGACGEALAAMLGAPVSRYRQVVDALEGMLAAIAAEPSDVRIRVIREGNEGFRENLGRHPGVRLFLRGVGFEPQTWESLPAGLGIGPGAPNERFLMLQEPDMFTAYEAWLAWHDRIKGVARFLQDLKYLAFQRIAHLGQHGLDVATHTVLSGAEVLGRWAARNG